jgi:hypothetical protein
MAAPSSGRAGRFQKGKSGNPSGRPRRTATERAKALALKEAYRTVTVRDGDRVASLPAIQAVLRSQMAAAAKGNVAAQRAFLATVQEIELEYALAEQARAAKRAAEGPFNYIEAARRVSFLLRLGEHQEKEQKAQAARDNAASTSDGVSGDAQARPTEGQPR